MKAFRINVDRCFGAIAARSVVKTSSLQRLDAVRQASTGMGTVLG